MNDEEAFLNYGILITPYQNVTLSYAITNDPATNGQMIPRPIYDNADAWTKGVNADLTMIFRSNVGHILLRSLQYYGQVFSIRPPRKSTCNAQTGEGYSMTSSSDLFNGKPDHLNEGTGGDIAFDPFEFQAGGTCVAKDLRVGGYATQSNEILFHEMIHTLRHISGKFLKQGVGGGLSFYFNNEEFNAVLLQGIYASERHRPVRASHYNHTVIDKALGTSKSFFKTGSETFAYVEKFCQENPGFTKAIANIDTRFNPLRAYYNNREEVRKLSNSMYATSRDIRMPIARQVVHYLNKVFP